MPNKTARAESFDYQPRSKSTTYCREIEATYLEIMDHDSRSTLAPANNGKIPARIPYNRQHRAIKFEPIHNRASTDVPDNQGGVVSTTRQVISLNAERKTVDGVRMATG